MLRKWLKFGIRTCLLRAKTHNFHLYNNNAFLVLVTLSSLNYQKIIINKDNRSPRRQSNCQSSLSFKSFNDCIFLHVSGIHRFDDFYLVKTAISRTKNINARPLVDVKNMKTARAGLKQKRRSYFIYFYNFISLLLLLFNQKAQKLKREYHANPVTFFFFFFYGSYTRRSRLHEPLQSAVINKLNK